MALKPDRHEFYYEQAFFINEEAEAGILVVYDTFGTGGMDQATNTVAIPTDGSGTPAGILLFNIKDECLLKGYNDTIPVGSKAPILKKGFLRTNMIVNGVNPVGGDNVYWAAGGLLTNTGSGTVIGTWTSTRDEDGFAKVELNI